MSELAKQPRGRNPPFSANPKVFIADWVAPPADSSAAPDMRHNAASENKLSDAAQIGRQESAHVGHFLDGLSYDGLNLRKAERVKALAFSSGPIALEPAIAKLPGWSAGVLMLE